MKRLVFGSLSALAAVLFVGSCKEDPTASLAANPAAIALQFSYHEIIVADSLRSYAVLLSEGANPLPDPVTVTSCDQNVVTVAPASDAPLTRTAFYVRAEAFGTTCVVGSAGNIVDTMEVATFPAAIAITSGPDIVLSGATASYTFAYSDKANQVMTGVPDPTWSSSATSVAAFADPAVGTVQGKSPGLATITAKGPEVQATKQITVVPGVFAGGVTPTSGNPGDTIAITNAVGGPGFDSDTRAFFNGVRTFTFGVTTNAMSVVVPGIGATGSVTLAFDQLGPNQVAQNTTFTSNTASFLDVNDPASDAPSTAPALAGNGDYYTIEHGTCTDGVVTDPGDDCDDFYVVTNSLARPDTISVRLDWFTGSDVDILWCRNVGCTSVTSGGGATSANPENSTVIIPAGTPWYLWINLFDPAGAPSVIARVRVSGIG